MGGGGVVLVVVVLAAIRAGVGGAEIVTRHPSFVSRYFGVKIGRRSSLL